MHKCGDIMAKQNSLHSADFINEKEEILILMSTYNGEKYIEQQIESIEHQKCDIPISILIRDDGSEDNTIKIIDKLTKKYKNIELIKCENIGCTNSFFELFKLAPKNYKYYAISDQDDIWLEDKVQRGIDKLNNEDNKKPLLYGSCSELMNNNGDILGTTQKVNKKISLMNTIIQNFIPGHSQIFNTKLLEYLQQNVDPSQLYVYDFWITNVAMLYGKIIFDNKPGTHYRIHDMNTIGYGKNKIQWIKERLNRFNKGDGDKIISQINYFYELYKNDMNDSDRKQISKIFMMNKHISKRIQFVFTTKVYRQKKIETIMFKLAYLFGKYKN